MNIMILPKPEIVAGSFVKDYEKIYAESCANPGLFWENIAKELSWYKTWDRVLDWQYPYGRWFTGGKCNIVQNALDRHMQTATKEKLAYIWEGQDGTVRQFTYGQLNEEVCRFANVLKSLGLKRGDHASIYLPRIPEQIIAMLGCAKIGVVHTVVFSGFSIEALKNRIVDGEAKIVITADGYPYKDKTIECKSTVDEAIKELPQVEHVIVVKRAGNNIVFNPGKDLWWDEVTKTQSTDCPTEQMDATDPLFILYTSGTTGKPKGIIHSQGGYMVGAYITLKWTFNLTPDDVYFCTADAGWITGHSFIVYSPLMNGVTTFIYESVPDYPNPGKWWQLIEKYKVTKFYTAPTAIRSLMRYGDNWPRMHNLSSLKILGSVGEPINPEAWLWFHEKVGNSNCPVIDTWWQTETGMAMIAPLPSVPLKPGSAFKPFPGIEADIVDDKGIPVPPNTQGFLVINKPWPAMFLDVYKNPQKYREAYWEVVPTKVYFTGDSAKKDEDGYYWIIGRNDDVLKVSGHRLGSAELESALVSHHAVAEAAVIGKPHEIKGESIKAFVILKQGVTGSDQLKEELKQEVRKQIGPIATPDEIDFVDKLPKTRSGKIMRRVLKAQELGQPVGDTSTLENQ